MIEVNRVSYPTASDKRPVLTDVNMTRGPGLYLLTGERASGTTELMQVMASLRRPQSGEVLINGLDVAGRRPSVFSRLAYMGPDTVFPVNTIAEMTTSHAIFYPHFSPQALDENLIRLRIGADDRLTELADADRHLVMAAYLQSLNPDLRPPRRGHHSHAHAPRGGHLRRVPRRRLARRRPRLRRGRDLRAVRFRHPLPRPLKPRGRRACLTPHQP